MLLEINGWSGISTARAPKSSLRSSFLTAAEADSVQTEWPSKDLRLAAKQVSVTRHHIRGDTKEKRQEKTETVEG